MKEEDFLSKYDCDVEKASFCLETCPFYIDYDGRDFCNVVVNKNFRVPYCYASSSVGAKCVHGLSMESILDIESSRL